MTSIISDGDVSDKSHVNSTSFLPASSSASLSHPQSSAASSNVSNLSTCDTHDDITNMSADDSANNFILVWYLEVIYAVAFATIVLVAAGGNLIVVWIVLGHKRMRTVTNYFLVNLAVADVLITVFNTTVNSVYLLHNDWWFGRSYCKFAQFIGPCTISACVFTFMAIAIDRFIVIIYPLKPRIPASHVLSIISIIWVTSFLIALPNLLYAETYSFPNRTVCYVAWPESTEIPLPPDHLLVNGSNANNMTSSCASHRGDVGENVDERNTPEFAYNIFLLLVNYVIPLTALAMTYTRVGVELWGSHVIGERTAAHDETFRSKRRVVKMMVVIVVIFASCWLPQHVFFIITSRYSEITNHSWAQHAYLAIYWIAMSNSVYNPIIYCWMNARFRSGFKYALRWIPCVHWQLSDAAGLRGYTASPAGSTTEHTRFAFPPPSCHDNNDVTAPRPGSGRDRGGGGAQRHPLLVSPTSSSSFVYERSKVTWVFNNRPGRHHCAPASITFLDSS